MQTTRLRPRNFLSLSSLLLGTLASSASACSCEPGDWKGVVTVGEAGEAGEAGEGGEAGEAGEAGEGGEGELPAVCEALALARPMQQLCPPSRLIVPCAEANSIPAEAQPACWSTSPASEGQPLFSDLCLLQFNPELEGCELGAAPEAAPVAEAARDCQVRLAAPTTGAGPAAPHSVFEEWLTRHASLTAQLPQAQQDVRVAVIDNQGTHGDLMVGIIEASPNDCRGGCARSVERYAGMGSDGSWASQVAIEIERARQDWQAAAPGARLVINLSLAWERFITDPQREQSPMVYRALRRASCDGALIIAASGNESPYACPAGPVEPAMWEQRLRPTQQACQAEFGVSAAWPDCQGSDYCPLIYAIGAVDVSEGDLPDFREGSRSRLATLGDEAVVAGKGPMSGTSVSAAVMSGVAARLWSHMRASSGDEIMAALMATGEARKNPAGQPLRADLSLGQAQASNAAQVLARPCAALLELLGQPSATGGGPIDCAWSPSARTLALRAMRYTVQVPQKDVTQCPEAECGDVGSVVNADALGDAAPEPWAGPQPGAYPCPPCMIKDFADGTATADPNNTAIELEIGADYYGKPFSGVLITLWDELGNPESHLYTASELGDPATGTDTEWTGEPIQVKDPALFTVEDASGVSRPPTKGWVEIRFNEGSKGNKLGGFN